MDEKTTTVTNIDEFFLTLRRPFHSISETLPILFPEAGVEILSNELRIEDDNHRRHWYVVKYLCCGQYSKIAEKTLKDKLRNRRKLCRECNQRTFSGRVKKNEKQQEKQKPICSVYNEEIKACAQHDWAMKFWRIAK